MDALREERIKKLNSLQNAGIDAYPPRIKRDFEINLVISDFDKFIKAKKKISLVGRLVGLRVQGALFFADLKDESGKIQILGKKDNLKNFDIFKDTIDIGDFIEVSGIPFVTKRGEKSLEAKSIRIIVKSLRPIPSDWYGISDIELRLRKRYLDILASAEIKELFKKKSIFWATFRDELKKEGFLEVETPILETTPGGADAEPFKTHHNALDTDFYLRISLEISLKKLLVAGYEKVFEIGRIFRNEGIDAEHLQDYTQIEFYWAYKDYNDLMKFIEPLYKKIIKNTFGSLKTEWHGQKIDWGKKWPKISYYDLFREKLGIDLEKASTADLEKKVRILNLKIETNSNRGRLIDVLFKTIRKEIIQPVFLIDQPAELEPLAKRNPASPHKVERMQIIACGTELGKGFSEANDPLDQRARFEEQMKMREAGDKEAQMLDEEFLEALEYGMPPTAGFGISERLFAVLADKPIRECVFFPLMKRAPKKED
ncbi:MAG: lysine--tRNA ligase [Candidatus Pacebacteria bacterium]|nr:lysine--tRNA ligase [Candidatus Paceibacterota bacterium]